MSSAAGGTGARWRRRSILVLAVGLLLWFGASAYVTRRLTSRRAPLTAEPPPPASWGVVETVRLETSDGLELGGWYAAGEGAGGDRAAVLLLHGIGGSRSSCGQQMGELARAGHPVLALTLRAHGDSEGATIDFGWSSARDVVAGVAFLERRSPGAAVAVVATSLGSAAAIFAAPELGARVAAYALEAPYRDLFKATRDRLELHLPAGLDSVAYAGLRLWAPLFLEVDPTRVRPIDYVARMPAGRWVIFLAGSEDRHAPLDDVRELAEACSGQAELVVFEGADHGGLSHAAPELYGRTVAGLLERVEREASSASTPSAQAAR